MQQNISASYGTSFTVNKSGTEVFEAITNVNAWWSGQIEGQSDAINQEFSYKYSNVHRSIQKVTEFAPGKRLVWHVIEANLSFLKDKTEWEGTDIVFEISENAGNTVLKFTHYGLTPTIECYGACSNAWSMLINGNLKKFIETGKKQPDVFSN